MQAYGVPQLLIVSVLSSGNNNEPVTLSVSANYQVSTL